MIDDIVNLRRRMVVNKFSNRPPFSLKEKITANQQKLAVNQIKKKNINSSEEVPKKKTLSVGNQTLTSNNRKLNSIIPKVIESFQKVTPKIDSNYMDSSQDSLRTLFRNSNLSFGKHIPNHILMKNLLRNFDVDKKREKVAYEVVDIVPRYAPNAKYRVVTKKSQEDPSSKCTVLTKKSWDERHSKNRILKTTSLEQKVDKSTSTSGLVWPSASQNTNKNRLPPTNDILQKRFVKTNSKQFHSHRRNVDIIIETYDTTTDYSSERKPSNQKTSIIKESGIPVKENNTINNRLIRPHKSCSKCKGFRQDTFVVEKNVEGKIQTGRFREKSFVQRQVEKLNALYAGRSQLKPAIDLKRLGSRKFSYTHPIEVK